MERKFSHIILSVLMLVSTMGMTVSKHYCAGELVSVSMYYQNDGFCDMGDCCQSETYVYQMKENFSVPVVSTVPVLAELEILGHDLIAGIGLVIPEAETDVPAFAESPPLLPIRITLAFKQVYLL